MRGGERPPVMAVVLKWPEGFTPVRQETAGPHPGRHNRRRVYGAISGWSGLRRCRTAWGDCKGKQPRRKRRTPLSLSGLARSAHFACEVARLSAASQALVPVVIRQTVQEASSSAGRRNGFRRQAQVAPATRDGYSAGRRPSLAGSKILAAIKRQPARPEHHANETPGDRDDLRHDTSGQGPRKPPNRRSCCRSARAPPGAR